MSKHAFGTLTPCANCGTPVAELYGLSLEMVLNGFGLCETCYKAGQSGETEIQKISQPIEIKIPIANNDHLVSADNVGRVDGLNESPKWD
jgi:hypothetical protein